MSHISILFKESGRRVSSIKLAASAEVPSEFALRLLFTMFNSKSFPLPSNGYLLFTSRNNITPSDQTSILSLYVFLKTSGARYRGVTQNVCFYSEATIILAHPKSVSFTLLLQSSKILAGFRSRCAIFYF